MDRDLRTSRKLPTTNTSRLYVITNSLLPIDFFQSIEDALRGGIGVLQYRDKPPAGRHNKISIPDLDERKKIAQELCRLAHSYNSLFIVNDSLEIAIEVNADGVHLGPNDTPIETAKYLMGDKIIIGASCYSLEQAVEAQDKGADYISLQVWRSATTKEINGYLPVGPGEFRKISSRLGVPVVAIGGITKLNLGQIIRAGADYIAMASGVLVSKDVEENTRQLNRGIRIYEDESFRSSQRA